jgi:hypothetical protein
MISRSNPVTVRLHISEGDGVGRRGRHNTDGFDPYGCEDVSFVDSYYYGGDDCVAIKSGVQVDGRPYADTCKHPSRRIVVDNVTCAASHGLSIGSEVSAGVETSNFDFPTPSLHTSSPPPLHR